MRCSLFVSSVVFGLLGCTSLPDTSEPSPDGGSDGGAVVKCSLPMPQIGKTADTAGLASAAAHCGIPAFSWLTGADLGDVTGQGLHAHLTAAELAIILAVGKIPPQGALHEVDLDQIAYLTQDRGKKIEATALVAYPSDLASRSSLDVLLVLHGTAGFNDSCAPSSTEDARPLVAGLAALGYVVVAPDYIGLRALNGPTGFVHPYLVGQPTAIASLDAVRAAGKLLAAGTTPVCAATRFATVGGSQGGHAALWVDRLAPYYAQEFQHVGVVATVPPADLVAEGTRALRQKVPATANIAAFFAATSDWYGTRAKLNEVFVPPLDKDVVAELSTTCSPGGSFKDKDLTAVFSKTVLDAATANQLRTLMPWGCLISENGLTSTTVKRIAPSWPGYGMLFVLGESDTLVDPATERQSFDTLCGQGVAMQYLECAGASHTKATQWALPEIVDFVRDRFAGKAPDAALSCKRGAAQKCRATP